MTTRASRGALAAILPALMIACKAATGEAEPGGHAEGTGRVCLATFPRNAAQIDREYRGIKPQRERREYTYRFSARVDDREWVDLSTERPVPIDGVPLGRDHVLHLRDGDRIVDSFPFTFEEKKSRELCLSYTPWYQKWRLDPPPPSSWWCDCETGGKVRTP